MPELAVSGLSEQHRAFVVLVAEKGLEWGEAAERVGYTADYGRKLCRLPAVAAAIHETIQFRLQTDLAPIAVKVARELLTDASVSARVRADLSMKVLDRAGHIVPSRKDSGPQKAISEMSQAELLAFIERNQAAIDRAEAELAGQARDITPQDTTPAQAKPLNFLD